MTSIIVPAHNEASLIGGCLDTLLRDAEPGEFDVTVVPNGCTDDTAAVAAARGVRVVEVAQPGKAAALNVGDDVAVGFPRVYLDADIVVSTAAVRALRNALSGETARDTLRFEGGMRILAAVPRRELELSGRPLPVRCYFAINRRLPVFEGGLFGRGMIALSAAGRARFERFPEMVADDLFLDSLFSQHEKAQVDEVAAIVSVPLRTRDLIDRLVRVRRGNAAMRSARREGLVQIDVREPDRLAWLRDVVRRQPRLAPAGFVYASMTAWAAVLAKRTPESDMTWGRDESTRVAAPRIVSDPRMERHG